MSLEQPSRLANWPRIAVRVVLILVVFFGLNWWVKTHPTPAVTNPTVVEQAYEPPAAEVRDGIAVVFVWDVSLGSDQLRQGVKSASFDADQLAQWRDAAATSLYHQLQRLTRYASEHSRLPLRVAIVVVGQKESTATSSTTQPDQPPSPMVLLPVDAPSANTAIRKLLASVEPGGQIDLKAAYRLTQHLFNTAGLQDKHVILLTREFNIPTSQPANQPSSQTNTTVNALLHFKQEQDPSMTYHVVIASGSSQVMDKALGAQFDAILYNTASPQTQAVTQPAAQSD